MNWNQVPRCGLKKQLTIQAHGTKRIHCVYKQSSWNWYLLECIANCLWSSPDLFHLSFLLQNYLFRSIVHWKPNEVQQICSAVPIGAFVETGGLAGVCSHGNPDLVFHVPCVVPQNSQGSEVCLTMHKLEPSYIKNNKILAKKNGISFCNQCMFFSKFLDIGTTVEIKTRVQILCPPPPKHSPFLSALTTRSFLWAITPQMLTGPIRFPFY